MIRDAVIYCSYVLVLHLLSKCLIWLTMHCAIGRLCMECPWNVVCQQNVSKLVTPMQQETFISDGLDAACSMYEIVVIKALFTSHDVFGWGYFTGKTDRIIQLRNIFIYNRWVKLFL